MIEDKPGVGAADHLVQMITDLMQGTMVLKNLQSLTILAQHR